MAALNFPNTPTIGQIYEQWTWDGATWELTPPEEGSGGGGDGGSGFTFVQDTAPVPVKEGDTWFDTSTAASGGSSWVAVTEVPGSIGPLNWVQFAPGAQVQPQSRGGIWRRAAALSVPTSTWTTITFDAEDEDTHGMLAIPGSILTPGPGVFACTLSAAVGASGALNLMPQGGMIFSATPDIVTGWATVAMVYKFGPTETLFARVWQNSGSTTNSTNMARLEIRQVGS